MKVRNISRLFWPKGMELSRDLQSGEEGVVLAEAENNDRLRNAIASGVLEIVTEVTHIQTSAGIVQIVQGDDPFESSIGQEAINPAMAETKRGAVRRLTEAEASKVAKEVSTEKSEIDGFKHRKGGAKVKFVKEMTDVKALRQVLSLSKGAKVLAAAQARIEELSNVAKAPEEMIQSVPAPEDNNDS